MTNKKLSRYKMSPFWQNEQRRQILARERNFEELRETYFLTNFNQKNLNTLKFWDHQFLESDNLVYKNGVTKDRINTALSFMGKDSRRILDIGVGRGYLEEKLDRFKKLDIYGIDISGEAIKAVRRKNRGNFKVCSVYKMDFPPQYFDTIFALEILEHIPPTKILSIYKEIGQMLVPGGIFIISVPLNEGLLFGKENKSGHLREYTEHLIKAELSLAGFKIVQSQELFAFKKFYSIKKVLQKIFIFNRRWSPNSIVLRAKKVNKYLGGEK